MNIYINHLCNPRTKLNGITERVKKSQLQLPLNADAPTETKVQRQSDSRKTLMKDVMQETLSV